MRWLYILFFIMIGTQIHAETELVSLPLAVSRYYHDDNPADLKKLISTLRKDVDGKFASVLNQNETIRSIIHDPTWTNDYALPLRNEKNLRDLIKLYLVSQQKHTLNTIADQLDSDEKDEYQMKPIPIEPQDVLSNPFIQQLLTNNAVTLDEYTIDQFPFTEMLIRVLLVDSVNRQDASNYIRMDRKKGLLCSIARYYQYVLAEANFDDFFEYWAKNSTYLKKLSQTEWVDKIVDDSTIPQIFAENLFLPQLTKYIQSEVKTSYCEAKHLAEMNPNNEYSALYLIIVALMEKNQLEERIRDLETEFPIDPALNLPSSPPAEMIYSLQQELIPEELKHARNFWPRRIGGRGVEVNEPVQREGRNFSENEPGNRSAAKPFLKPDN